MSIVLVTGTDTGVGKTVISSFIAAALRSRSVACQIVKPIETGCRVENGERIGSDSEFIQQAMGTLEPLARISPHRFVPPVSPHVAAAHEGTEIDTDAVEQFLLQRASECDLLIVEGAGGLLVPLKKGYTFADLAERCSMSVVVVVGSRLGAINHSLLTFEVLRSREIPVLGYVLNELSEQQGCEFGIDALSTNREAINAEAKAYGVEELFEVPHLEPAIPAQVVALANSPLGVTAAAAILENLAVERYRNIANV